MSSGTRSSKTRAEENVPTTITAEEVEAIVKKAVSSAVNDIKNLFNSKLEELSERVLATEARLLELEERITKMENSHSTATGSGLDQLQAQAAHELSAELQAVRSESRESLIHSNDNEQDSRRNNILKPDKENECHAAAVKFINNVLHVTTVSESDIEVAHMTAGSGMSSANQRRPTVLVRFCRRDVRDAVIRSRRILKGSHFAVTEDLTALNIKTMNRLKNDDRVRNVWSWNGKIYVILTNGKKVTVKPFQSVSEFI